ncbi:MAG: DUF3500 domain-containing protein [Candidatus Hydrogenedentota bacterium]
MTELIKNAFKNRMRIASYHIAFVLVAALSTGASADLLSATTAFLDSLDDAQKAEVMRDFDSEERTKWHFIPMKRQGPAFETLSDKQDKLLLDVVRAGLSEEGFGKSEMIRKLEGVLFIMEGAAHRNPEDYHILVFGEPKAGGDYTVRYEGHHQSLHWTVIGGKLVSGGPQFMGTNPAEVRIDHELKGTRVLVKEEDLARELVTSLSDKQQAVAIIGKKVPNDIFSANSTKAERLEDVGIRYGDLNKKQKVTMARLIEVVAQVQSDTITQKRVSLVQDGLDDAKFAWLGSTDVGRPHYYRIQGAKFLIEYDNIQNKANHIHVVWRDFDGDFGADLLKEHHAAHEH